MITWPSVEPEVRHVLPDVSIYLVGSKNSSAMKITVEVEGFMPSTFEVTKTQARTICENSLERVLNTAHKVALHSTHQDANVVMDDITDLKRFAVNAWVAMQNAIFAATNDVRNSL